MTNCPAPEELRRTVCRWDPKLPEGSPAFNAALLMPAALYLGSNHLERLCQATGVRRGSRVVARNLRAAGIWTEDGRTAAAWDGPHGEADFWCDVNGAIGVFVKRRRPDNPHPVGFPSPSATETSRASNDCSGDDDAGRRKTG